MNNTEALDIISDKLYLLFNFKNMVILFKEHPSICIEHSDLKYRVSMTYISKGSLLFSTHIEVFEYIELYCRNKNINRIEVNGTTISVVYFGDIYEHEKRYLHRIMECNVIKWEPDFLFNLPEAPDSPVYI
jgi:hypothetical protein